VDDNGDDILLAELTIRRAAIPFRLRQFETMPAAVAYLKGEGSFADRAVHPLPSAVLLHHQLAGCNRADALPELRKLPGCSRMPWVIVSGTESPAKIAYSYQAGADHFLVKPPDTERLRQVLQTLYDCVTAVPSCYLLLQALAEYRPSPTAGIPSISSAPPPATPSAANT
jgi:CheY-like chemotaxis protein